MSGLELPRLIAPLALLLLPTIGCGASEQGSTLPSDGREANPPGQIDLVLAPPTPATLADYVEWKAHALAERSYTAPDSVLPPALDDLDYEGYQAIRFRPEAALWRGESAFEVQLLPRGSLFRDRIRVHVVQDGDVVEMPFDAKLYTFDGPLAHVGDEDRAALGFSGFRVHYPLNRAEVADEVAVFQGASYFRLLGPGQVHGLSGRGLAIDIGEYAGEEFPDFTEFWLVRPDPGDTTLVVHALLDGPSVTGAYRFELTPGVRAGESGGVGRADVDADRHGSINTVLSVDAHVFARRDVVKLGVAPFSSMYLYGPERAGDFDDFRPRVHDSEGLLMQTRFGEWIWRPIANRTELRLTALRDDEPRGFGLAQRARDFDDYLDSETLYHRRPSVWVQTEDGDWGTGGVELLETPTDSEFRDNIAASWVPDEPFSAGEERRYRYRLITFDHRLDAQTLAQVERTGIGWDALPGQAAPPPRSQRRFIVDFAGGTLDHAPGDADVTAVLRTSAGTISDVSTLRLPAEIGWRVSFRLTPDAELPADMGLHLELGGARVSETWSYVWYPGGVR